MQKPCNINQKIKHIFYWIVCTLNNFFKFLFESDDDTENSLEQTDDNKRHTGLCGKIS